MYFYSARLMYFCSAVDKAPIQHLIFFVGNVRQNCAASFNERFEVVDMRGARRHTDP